MKGQAADITTPPSSPTALTFPPTPAVPRDKTLRKNYSMCEDLLVNHDLLWDKNASGESDFGLEDLVNNNRVNFKLGATLSLPPALLVGDRELDGGPCGRSTEFQMGKEDEARCLSYQKLQIPVYKYLYLQIFVFTNICIYKYL
jgi:hypothetical protein